MIRINIFFSAMMAAFFAVGCVSDVDFESHFSRQVVMNCILNEGEEQTAYLTYNGGQGELQFDPVPSASVKLIDVDAGKEVGFFSAAGGGRWELNFVPSPGTKYRIEVTDIPGAEPLSAESVMPVPAAVSPNKGIGHQWSEKLYNGMAAILNEYEEFRMGSQSSALWIYRVYYTLNAYALHPYVGCIHPDVDIFNADDKLIIHARQHLGYVRIAPPDDSIEYPLYFQIEWAVAYEAEDRLVNYISTGSNPEFKPAICFVSVSDEYDKYLKSGLQRMKDKMDPDNPILKFDEVTDYSNVKGGLGIFGAAYTYYAYDPR